MSGAEKGHKSKTIIFGASTEKLHNAKIKKFRRSKNKGKRKKDGKIDRQYL